ncbi:MAG: fumarylacetoacetate hydrolase family protein [Solobacterium sp.]|nr:fumarylacetoacetate hydrolase family protein [Solobacterium sp.]
MKLVTFLRNGNKLPEVGVLKETGVVPVEDCGLMFVDMNDLILNINSTEENYLDRMAHERRMSLSLHEVTLLAPIVHPMQDVICLGLNYTEHVEEAKQYSGEAFDIDKPKAVYFSKRCFEAPGTGAPVSAYVELTQKLDYEAELAVIIGKEAYKVAPEDTEQYVFGYTVLNDLTARDVQTAHSQWYFGKSLEGFCPMGPCIVTRDEFEYPPKLQISSAVNGELRQSSTTDLLIHSIPEIISELSQGMRLMPGTIIATGTPKGTGMGLTPPVFLKKGDTVVCSIEGIGDLETPIV